MDGMSANYIFLYGVCAVLGLGGCSQTTGVGPAGSAATAANVNTASDPAKPPRVIAKGMDAEEIVRRIGKPTEIRPLETPEGQAEVWVYRRNAGQESTLAATSVIQVPIVHPLTGVQYNAPEARYSMERRDLVETTNLLMFDGKLVEWTRTVEGKRSFN